MKKHISIACIAAAVAAVEANAEKYTPTDLRVMAAGCLVADGNPHDIPADVVVAFAMKESSGRNLKPYQDGEEQAWGIYAFHESRWQEGGGKASEWGKASALRQTQVMVNCLNRYMASAKRNRAKSRIAWAANYHNRGHGSDTVTPYVRQLTAILKDIGQN